MYVSERESTCVYMCMLPICMYVSERVGIGPLRDRVPLCICVCYLYVCELERERERGREGGRKNSNDDKTSVR